MPLPLLNRRRQPHLKHCPALLPVRRLDRPAQSFDDRVTNRKPESRPLACRLRRDERVEHLVDDLVVDPRPIVLNDELHDTAAITGSNLDAAFAAKGVRRVEKQV